MARSTCTTLVRSVWLAAGALVACQPADGPQPAQTPSAAPAAEPAAGESIPAGPWRLVAIRRPGAAEEQVAGEARYTLEFGVDGRYSGRADCNRYMGGYTQPSPGRIAIAGGPMTLAACPPPSIADEFMRALGAAERFELRGDELVLSYGSGGELRFAREAEAVAGGGGVGRTFVYDCDAGVSFTVRTGPGEVALWVPASLGGRYLVLAESRSASGARYAEGDTVFWSKGDLATFVVGGQRYVDCRSNPSQVPWADARRRGAVLRALGNEPAWNLEIYAERLAMVTDLGATRTEMTYATPIVEGARTTYRAVADGRELTAVVERRACQDSMSGEAFDAAVTVTFADRQWHGCGRVL